MLEAFELPFMQRALVAALLLGVLAAFYGSFVVQRGLSFLGSGLAHAAFGGVALGLLLDVEPLLTAVPFTVAVALGISWVGRGSRLSSDTTIGIFFSLSMALGIVFLSLKQGYSSDAFAYLFGSILAVSRLDIGLAAGLVAVAVAATRLWGRWAYASFDRDLARADGLPVDRDDDVLSLLIALTVVAAIKIVGIVLVAAFLVIPPATARLWSSRFGAMTVGSLVLGGATAVLGLLGSYRFDLPSGATIILLQASLFFVAFAATRFKRNER